MQGIDLYKLHTYRRGTAEEKFIPQLVDGKNKIEVFKKLQYESNVMYLKVIFGFLISSSYLLCMEKALGKFPTASPK